MALNKGQINKTVPIPLYFQLKEAILTEIKNGTYGIGELIPTENELSDIFEISRTTVRQAIAELVNEGWMYRVKSKGTYVSKPKIHQDFISRIESFHDEMTRKGLVPTTEVLELKIVQAGEQAARNLDIKEHEKVIFLHRKRCANGEPVVIIKTYLPLKRCEFLLDKDFTKTTLYSQLDVSKETRISYIRRKIEADVAKASDVEHLNIAKDKAIQCFKSVGYNEVGVAIEYSLARYRGDRNEFEIEITRNG